MSDVGVYHADLFEALPTFEAESFDCCITDPPYGIGFMGKEWDTFRPEKAQKRAAVESRVQESDNPNLRGRKRSPASSPAAIEYDFSPTGMHRFQEWCQRWAVEVYRVLKPGGYLLVCGGPRSFHRMTCGVEDAGFEIRDCLCWLYGSGFPKSLNIGCKCGHNNMSSMSSVVPGLPENAEANEDPDMLSSLQRHTPLRGSQTARLSQSEGDAAASGRSQRPKQLCVEGRSDVQAKQGQLHRPEVCEVPGAVSADGKERRVRDGASSGSSSAGRAVSAQNRGCPSSRSQHAQQQQSESGAVSEQQRAQTSGGVCPKCGGLVDWQGYGTALKPAWEPIIVARKPLVGTVAQNVQEYGTGALNIDACRLNTTPRATGNREGEASADRNYAERGSTNFAMKPGPRGGDGAGRWPANVVLDEEAGRVLDAQTGTLTSGTAPNGLKRNGDTRRNTYAPFKGTAVEDAALYGDSGGASRFFYCAKTSRRERDMGCENLPARTAGEATDRQDGTAGLSSPRAGAGRTGGARNIHPTVKPLALMRWLVRLVCPPGGIVLDPFAGSGSTGVACCAEGRDFVGLEIDETYTEIAQCRIEAAQRAASDKEDA